MTNENRQPIVWVVQDNNYNIISARKWGTLRFITQHDFRMVSGDRSEKMISDDIIEFLKEYVPGVDCVLLVGNLMAVSLIFAGIGWRYPREVHRILKWDNRESVYIEYPLNTILLSDSQFHKGI